MTKGRRKKNKCRIPVVGVEAVAPETRSFNWKDYYTRSLFALEEPLIDYKFDYGVRGIYHEEHGGLELHLTFDGSNANDQSGNGNNGTVSGM